MTAVVEPGVILGDLQHEVEKFGLFYPPDPSNLAVSTIGGSIAQSSGGAKSFKYGTTKDYVIDLKSEYYVGIYFLVGFWSDGILTLLYKRSTIIKFIRSIVANIGPIGKVIAQAWEDVEKDNIQTREERNNIKKNNKNKNTEKDCN